MSSGQKRTLAEAKPMADWLREFLAPACERVEIAGSVRRESPMIGDIELVAIPHIETLQAPGTLFGVDTVIRDHLYDRLGVLINEKAIMPIKGYREGARMMQFATRAGLKLDLFICDVNTWAINYTIRTGSRDFSQGLFTAANRIGLTSVGARLQTRSGEIIPASEEIDIFRILRVKWVRPQDRTGADKIVRIK